MEQTIADLTAIPHADKLITEIVRLRRLVKRIGKKSTSSATPITPKAVRNSARARVSRCDSSTS
jgi:hypothetical protein